MEKVEKVDFKKTLKHLYLPPAKDFSQVEVPAMQFVMVDGAGDPNTSPVYRQALEWLYSVSYGLKFASKLTLKRDYAVPPLEGLWWAEDMDTFLTREKDKWSWTMMIMVPDWIDRAMFDAAVTKAAGKLGAEPPASLRLEAFDEGLSVQIMHVGSYDAEGPTIARLHGEYLPANGLSENGHHHEIYIGDPRRTAPEKLKTVLRQPVRRA